MYHDVAGVALGDEESDGAGKLQPPPWSGVIRRRAPKIARSKRVAPRGHQIQRRILNRRLYYHAHDLLNTGVAGSRNMKDAIIRHLRRLHLHRQQHQAATLLAHPNHFAHGDGGLNRVAKKHNQKQSAPASKAGLARPAECLTPIDPLSHRNLIIDRRRTLHLQPSD